MAIKLKANREENKFEVDEANSVDENGNAIEVEDGTKKKSFPWGILCLALTVFSMFAMGFYALAPLITAFIILIALFGAAVYWLLTVAFPIICTLGIVLISDKYRAFAGTALDWARPLIDGDSVSIITFLENTYIYVFITTLVIVCGSLIYIIGEKVCDKKKDNDKTARLIVMIIVSAIFVVATIITGRMYL